MTNPYAAVTSCSDAGQTDSKTNRFVWVFALSSAVTVTLYFVIFHGFHNWVERFQASPIRHTVEIFCELLISALVGVIVVYRSQPPSNRLVHYATRSASGIAFAIIFLNSERLANSLLDLVNLQFNQNYDVFAAILILSVAITSVGERLIRRVLCLRNRGLNDRRTMGCTEGLDNGFPDNAVSPRPR